MNEDFLDLLSALLDAVSERRACGASEAVTVTVHVGGLRSGDVRAPLARKGAQAFGLSP